MQRAFLATLIITLSVFTYSCKNSLQSRLKLPATEDIKTTTKDTLSNEPHCFISIDDEQFNIPADSISSGYTFSDSSLIITFKGIDSGRLVVTIPNLFKCPYSIPTGYSSIRFKIADSNEYAIEPTVELYSYPMMGASFNNLYDGYHQKKIANNAIEILSARKTNENTNTGWAEYLIKGKINTTVLKNVYESAAGEKNKDYAVNGSFVIQTKIYL